ncbi:hypothetical protein K438DRAFT_2020874 [Mycena galopus ATCC 62051]|nr:hypothetical protein K438DRAFT_2020874 [Mycena galopus ATCC 62051]
MAPLAGDDTAIDPMAYVDALSLVHEQNEERVVLCFRGDTGFICALHQACSEFVKRNMAPGINPLRSAELLATHTDMLLRKGNTLLSESDLDSALNRLIILLKYRVDDKNRNRTHRISPTGSSTARCGFKHTSVQAAAYFDLLLSNDIS